MAAIVASNVNELLKHSVPIFAIGTPERAIVKRVNMILGIMVCDFCSSDIP